MNKVGEVHWRRLWAPAGEWGSGGDDTGEGRVKRTRGDASGTRWKRVFARVSPTWDGVLSDRWKKGTRGFDKTLIPLLHHAFRVTSA